MTESLCTVGCSDVHTGGTGPYVWVFCTLCFLWCHLLNDEYSCPVMIWSDFLFVCELYVASIFHGVQVICVFLCVSSFYLLQDVIDVSFPECVGAVWMAMVSRSSNITPPITAHCCVWWVSHSEVFFQSVNLAFALEVGATKCKNGHDINC